MKKIISLTITLIIFLVSCSPITKIEKQVKVYDYDFTKYKNKGFMFTPEMYSGDYEEIGLIAVEILPELRRVTSKYFSPGQYYTPDMLWEYVPVSSEEILDNLYVKAINMGADAIVNLSITDIELIYANVSAPGIRASGFAIKRKGAFKWVK